MKDNNEKKGLVSTLATITPALIKIFIIVGVVSVVAIAGYLFIDMSAQSSSNDIALALEAVEDAYTEWMDAEEKTDSAELIASYEKIQADFSGTYADIRAAVQIGNILFEEGRYAEAGEKYLAAGEGFDPSYLTSSALIRAGISFENADNTEKAVSAYSALVEKHDETSVDVPRALFSLARLSESTGDYPTAASFYEQLVDSYTESDWTKLAQSRIIDLKVKGLYE